MVLPNIGVVVTKRFSEGEHCKSKTEGEPIKKSFSEDEVYFVDLETHKKFIETIFSTLTR